MQLLLLRLIARWNRCDSLVAALRELLSLPLLLLGQQLQHLWEESALLGVAEGSQSL